MFTKNTSIEDMSRYKLVRTIKLIYGLDPIDLENRTTEQIKNGLTSEQRMSIRLYLMKNRGKR